MQDSLSGASELCASLDPGSELFHLLRLILARGQLPPRLCFKLKKQRNHPQFMGSPQGQCFWLSVFCSFVFWLVLRSFEASFILNCSTREKACLVIFSSHKEVFSGGKEAVLLSGYYHGFGLRYQSGWMRSCCSSKPYPYVIHTMCPSYLRLLKQNIKGWAS